MADSIQRNVVALPDREVTDHSIAISRRIAEKFEVEFVLARTDARPHLSLYQACYPPTAKEAVANVLRIVSTSLARFPVTLVNFDAFWDTLLFWDADRIQDPRLQETHERLVVALNPLREGRILPTHQQMLTDESLPTAYKVNINDAGNPLVHSLFRPHITITRLKDKADMPQLLDFVRQEYAAPVTFQVERLALSDVGPHGTCPNVRGEYPLG